MSYIGIWPHPPTGVAVSLSTPGMERGSGYHSWFQQSRQSGAGAPLSGHGLKVGAAGGPAGTVKINPLVGGLNPAGFQAYMNHT